MATSLEKTNIWGNTTQLAQFTVDKHGWENITPGPTTPLWIDFVPAAAFFVFMAVGIWIVKYLPSKVKDGIAVVFIGLFFYVVIARLIDTYISSSWG